MKNALNVSMIVALALLAPAAHAQWTVEVLHPAGAITSDAEAVTPTQQIGWAYMNDADHAIIWNGSASSYTRLTPRGYKRTAAWTAFGNIQGGYGDDSNNQRRALLWSGSAASLDDLTPAGAEKAGIGGISATQQVGSADFIPGPGGAMAALWSGTAASYINLHPVGEWVSVARAVANGVQVGYSRRSTQENGRAAMWSGSAVSFVDLQPAGHTHSGASDTSGPEVQVGWTHPSALSGRQAALWSGSAQSFINMTPATGVSQPTAKIEATTGEYHAGDARLPGGDHAGIWTGTDPNSFFDLHVLLPAGYLDSSAHGICEDAGTLYVVGFARNASTGNHEAMLWVGPAPGACYADCDQSTGIGVLDVFDFLCFQNSFVNSEPYACDCDTSTGAGVCDVFDFLCFQDAFVGGCR